LNAAATVPAADAPQSGRPLHILLAMCYLVHRTGAEMFTRDLALWLRRRGHAVTIFATAFGDMADELRFASIACVTELSDIAARPDVIIGNTHHETVRALLHFHDVPVLTICHDRSAEHGRPAQFTQVVCHVAVDENCAERLVHEFGIARERIELIQNGIDLSRFSRRGGLPARPRTALVFSNYASHDAQLEEIRAACVQRGLSLDVIGSGTGNHLPDPAEALGRYDIVFGKGRCATEALCTGNAVVVLDPSSGMGEMVTAATVAHARRWNFGRALLIRPITRENVGAELDRYDAEDAGKAGEWMRAHGGLDATLAGPGPYTVLVPSDDAFGKVQGSPLSDASNPKNRAEITRILTYHILPGVILADDIGKAIDNGKGKAVLATMGGETLTATKDNGKIVFTDAGGAKATVTQADIKASNGVIHDIDGVLTPPKMAQGGAKQQQGR